nr:DUF4157 domain-containing protein [Aquabacterium terrae]
MPASVQYEMSGRFGRDLSNVRVHTGPQAELSARDVSAKAYTVGHHIVFGAGHYAPDSARGKQLLAHELAHVVQQSGGGAYLARSVDDWLTGSVNVGAMSYTQLLGEVDELAQYLERQTESSPDTTRIEEALRALRAEVNRRDTAAEGPRARGRGGRRAATRASDSPLPARYPRVLTEMTSVAYADPAEMRAEYDLIMQWLARSEISANERRILTAERDSLSPQLRADRGLVAAESRAARLRMALSPVADDDARTLETLARTIQGIVAEPGSDIRYIYQGHERIGISAAQAEQLRRNLRTELERAARSIDSRASYYWDRYNSQLAINRDSPIIASISGWRVEDPGDELRGRYFWVYQRIRTIQEHLAADRLVEAAALLPRVEFVGQEMRRLSRAFYEGYIEGAETAVAVLEFTRDASFAIAGSVAAIVAAPIVAGVVAGTGATGVLAAGLTTVGTGLVVGTGTAVVRGGSAATGTAMAGGSWNEVSSAFRGEAIRGFREGFINGGAGAAARLLGPALGVGTSLGAQALRRVAAEAIVNGTAAMVDVLWQGGSLDAAVEAGARAAVLSVPGALLGGSNNPIVRNLVAPLTAGGMAYIGARASGASPGDAMQAAAVAVTTNILMTRSSHDARSEAALFDRGRAMGGRMRETAANATRRVALYGAATMIGVSDAVPPVRSSHGGTSTVLDTDMSPTAVISSTAPTSTADVETFPVTSTVAADDTAPAPILTATAADGTTSTTSTTTPTPTPGEASPTTLSSPTGADTAPATSSSAATSPAVASTAASAAVSSATPADAGPAATAPGPSAATPSPLAPIAGAQDITVSTATPGPVDTHDMGSQLSAELGLPAVQPATGTIAARTAAASADAVAGGFATPQGDPAGPVSAVVGEHRHASERNAATGQTGATRQSAHIGATSLLRTLLGYSRGAALTVLLPPAQHHAFDIHWMRWIAARRNSIRASGSTTFTAPLSDILGAQRRAIQQTPGLTQQQRSTLQWMLEREIQTFAANLPNGMATTVPLPAVLGS